MNRLNNLFQRLQPNKVQSPLPTTLRVLTPADQALVAGGLPHIGGLLVPPPATDIKPAA